MVQPSQQVLSLSQLRVFTSLVEQVEGDFQQPQQQAQTVVRLLSQLHLLTSQHSLVELVQQRQRHQQTEAVTDLQSPELVCTTTEEQAALLRTEQRQVQDSLKRLVVTEISVVAAAEWAERLLAQLQPHSHSAALVK